MATRLASSGCDIKPDKTTDEVVMIPFFKGCGNPGAANQVTPAFFRSLTDASRAEIILIMQDLGVPLLQIENVTGAALPDLKKILQVRHRVMPFIADEIHKTDYVEARRQVSGVPINAERALRWFCSQPTGWVQISRQQLEMQAGLGQCSSNRALEWLVKAGHLQKEARTSGPVAASYKVTQQGRKVLSGIDAERERDA